MSGFSEISPVRLRPNPVKTGAYKKHASSGMLERTDAGSNYLRNLEREFGEYNTHLALTYKLSPRLAELLTLLMREQKIKVERGRRSTLHRLRQALYPYGVLIHGNSIGWWIDVDTKQRICDAIIAHQNVIELARDLMTGA